MIRINLLPPEIIAKRKFESQRVYILLAGVFVLALLGAVWAYGMVQVGGRSRELQGLKSEAQQYRATAESYKVFESRKEDLVARQSVADKALADRILWGRLSDEVSLVLPSGMWVTRFAMSEANGVTIEGSAMDSGVDVPDAGHKEIAKLLVRLADLEQLYDVWLVSSEKGLVEEKPAINWNVTCRVRKPSEEASAAAASPAPPVQPVDQ